MHRAVRPLFSTQKSSLAQLLQPFQGLVSRGTDLTGDRFRLSLLLASARPIRKTPFQDSRSTALITALPRWDRARARGPSTNVTGALVVFAVTCSPRVRAAQLFPLKSIFPVCSLSGALEALAMLCPIRLLALFERHTTPLYPRIEISLLPLNHLSSQQPGPSLLHRSSVHASCLYYQHTLAS